MVKNRKHKPTKEEIFKNLFGCINSSIKEEKKFKSVWKSGIQNKE